MTLRCSKVNGKPRSRGRPGLPNETSAAGSVADVHRPPAEAERRQHAAGHVAAVIAATAEADAMAPVVVMVMRPDKNITYASSRYHCSGFTLRRFAVR